MADRSLSKTQPFSQGYAMARLSLDTATGVLTWRPKVEGKYFKRWNSRYAGKTAGYVAPVGYRYVSIDGHRLPEHRLIWLMVYGEWPDGIVDHIDRNPLNNRPDNLRLTDKSGNAANSTKGWGRSRFRGVKFNKQRQKWQSEVFFRGARKHVGYFVCEAAAAVARERVALKIQGEYFAKKRRAS